MNKDYSYFSCFGTSELICECVNLNRKIESLAKWDCKITVNIEEVPVEKRKELVDDLEELGYLPAYIEKASDRQITQVFQLINKDELV